MVGTSYIDVSPALRAQLKFSTGTTMLGRFTIKDGRRPELMLKCFAGAGDPDSIFKVCNLTPQSPQASLSLPKVVVGSCCLL